MPTCTVTFVDGCTVTYGFRDGVAHAQLDSAHDGTAHADLADATVSQSVGYAFFDAVRRSDSHAIPFADDEPGPDTAH